MMPRTVGIAIGTATGVGEALAQLRAKAPRDEAIVLHVALLPPIAQLRRVELPQMAAADAARVVARNIGRYFPDVAEPHTVAAHRSAGGWLAAVAPTAVVQAIHESCRGYGWEVGAIVPAHVAWASGAHGAISIVLSGETLVVEAARGLVRSVRRFRPGIASPEFGAARCIATDEAQAVAKAAAAVVGVSQLDLVPDGEQVRRAGIARRLGWSMLGAAAALVVIAGGITLWGEHRELAALRAHRATLQARVQQALASRGELLETSEKVNALVRSERAAQPWSAVIAGVAEALPTDASLSAFRAEADSVSLEGQAGNAAGVFAAMRSAGGFLAVRASSPVRQEGGGATGEPVIERFTMSARLGTTREAP